MTGSIAIVVAVGGSAPSAHSTGDWATAVVVMGALVLGFLAACLLLERIAVRAELERWLQAVFQHEEAGGVPRPIDTPGAEAAKPTRSPERIVPRSPEDNR